MTSSELPEVITRNGKNPGAELSNNGDTVEKKEISKIRESIPQVLAVSAKNLLLLTFGCTLGFPTILLGALQKTDPDIAVTKEEITWISSINLFAVPIGCLASGPLSQYLGRKRTMLIANIPFIAAWLIFYFATSAPYLFIALALTGLTGGLCEAPVLTYVAEITQPNLRGMLSATSSMAVIIGVFLQLLCGRLTDWRTTALINVSYPVLCFISLCMMPESPYWLAGHNRLKEAEKAMQWLRGWSTPGHIHEEFSSVVQSVQHPVEDNKNDNSIWKAFTKRTFINPFFLISIAFFISIFGGSPTLQTYAVYIFKSLDSPIEKNTATVFLGLAELIGTIICVIIIHFLGKRKITFISIGGTGVSFLFCSIYGFLIKYDYFEPKNNRWIPMTSLIGAAFFSHVGVRLLPWVLCGEVFPAKVRSSATGAAACLAYIFSSTINKVFLYMVDEMELAGTFLFYASVNFLGIIILYFLLPETEGRTLLEIEEHFAGINNLKNKPRKNQLFIKEKWATVNPGLNNEDCESKF